MSAWSGLLGFVAGLAIAAVTAPVGVSGAVFLLPFQLSVLNVPSPAVTPTNLLYNVVAAPGALLRYRRQGQLAGPLARLLLAGTLPGVVAGSVIRVFLVADGSAFRLVAAAVLVPIGVWLLVRTVRPSRLRDGADLHPAGVIALAAAVGTVGGIYGIGGGSVLGPLLVGSGMSVAVVAPAALASTFGTSLVGAATYAVVSLGVGGSIAPDWSLGVCCGLGGLLGGHLGARWQPRLPEKGLRLLLGSAAVAVGIVYVLQAVG